MIVMGANQDSVFGRLCEAMRRPELARDPRFVDHVARGEDQAELDALISDWSATLDAEPLLQHLNDFGVPAGRIYRAPDMLSDPHFAARRSIVDVPHPRYKDLKMQDVFPRMSATQGSIRWPGPPLGAHNDEVYGSLLGLDGATRAALARDGII
jgi:formyl-CoA transferase